MDKSDVFFQVIRERRSVRKFSETPFPNAYVERALEAAIHAPNSSNTQTWDFYWFLSPHLKRRAVELLFKQSAARTANHLIAIVADPDLWKRSQSDLIDWVEAANAPKPVHTYYKRLIPSLYRRDPLGVFSLLRWFTFRITSLLRPSAQGPSTLRDLQEIAIKSAALAAENFALAITAQGGATCMMEGFDEKRMKRLLKLKRSARIVMVIAVGYVGERPFWGPQRRLPLSEVVHRL